MLSLFIFYSSGYTGATGGVTGTVAGSGWAAVGYAGSICAGDGVDVVVAG